MAGSQQQQIIDTIFAMKRKLLRKDDSSDSEETDTPYNNRMQSLKRKAPYARSGKPESSLEAPPYKKRIEHAGYHRYILQRKPPRYDPDGDVVEPTDEYDDEDDLSDVEENPYADIQLEHLFAPLTSAADLPSHPSLSVPYISKHLTNLTAEAGTLSRGEQVGLVKAKNLFTKLQGDVSWVPQGLHNFSDEAVQDPWANGTSLDVPSVVIAQTPPSPTHQQAHPADQAIDDVDKEGNPNPMPDIVMEDAEHVNGLEPAENGQLGSTTAVNGAAGAEPGANGDTHSNTEDQDAPQQNGDTLPSPPGDDGSDTASQPTSHRMTTRARAHVASKSPTPPSSPSSLTNHIHPMFMFPTDSLPDRDFGLPAAEAEDTRMLLLAFIQKQEEIARAATDLYTGLLHGERMRQDVFKWSKAEAHVGEMSDGEDWYDREEWELDQDLMKGRDEEEDDGAVQGKKSTRQRRKPDKDDR